MKEYNHHALYEAFKAKDVRFDGRMFVGVTSTGIYCRPVCKAKFPKEEHCTFYSSAAQAEKEGYRPCLLCRPELAPGNSKIDASKNLAYRILKMIDDMITSDLKLGEIARNLKITDRHLRRTFHDEFHVAPMEYIQTRRVLLAKNLLSESNLSITRIAFASGFGSLRRFNETFKKHYMLPPRHFKNKRGITAKKSPTISLKIGYRPPYRYHDILAFFQSRLIKGVEKIEHHTYFRTIQIKKDDIYIQGYIFIANDEKHNALTITLSDSLLDVMPRIMEKIRHVFDLYCDPQVVFDSLCAVNEILPNTFKIGTRMPGSMDDFEICIRAIIGQLISVKSACTILERFVKYFNIKIHIDEEWMYCFPTPQDICKIQVDITDILGPLGITKAKAYAIQQTALLFSKEYIDFNSCADPSKERKRLQEIKGIGRWTAEYVAMRAMNDTDILLESDYVIKQIFKNHQLKSTVFQNFKPWRSYITIALWQLHP